MSESVGELRIDVTVELAQMQAKFDDLSRRTKGLNAKVNSEFRSMAKGIQSTMRSVAVYLAPAALIAFGKSVIDLGGHITDLANQSGISTQAFQTLSLHFADAGVNAEQFTKALVTLRKNSQEAVDGNKSLQASFLTLGIDAAKLQTLELEKQLEVLGLKISRATDKNAAFAAAMDILGAKNAPKLVASLKQLGEEGFGAVTEKFKDIRLSDEQLASLDAAGDKLDRMWATIKVLTAKAFLVTIDLKPSGSTTGKTFGDSVQRVWDSFFGDNSEGGKKKKLMADFAAMGRGPDAGNTPAAKPEAEKAALMAAVAPNAIPGPFSLLNVSSQIEDQAIFNQMIADINKGHESIRESADKAASSVVIDFESIARDGALSASAQKKWAADAAEMIKKSQTPQQEYAATLERINELEKNNNFTGLQAAEQRTEALKTMNEQLKRSHDLAFEMGAAFSFAFEDAILSGEKLSDVLGQLAKDILRIAFRSAITQPLGNALGSFFSSFKFFADGGEPPVGQPSIVGERGPELFVPKTAGTIIPNNGLGGAGKSGGTYYIDARGADRSGLAQLTEVVRKLNGSIEARALGAVAGARRRGAMA